VLAVAALRVADLPQLLPHDKPPRRSPWDNPPAAPAAAQKTPAAAAEKAPAQEAKPSGARDTIGAK